MFREYLLNELAYHRPKALGKIQGIQKPLTLHIIKVLRFEDDRNKNTHIADINNWFKEISLIKIRKGELKGKDVLEQLGYQNLSESYIEELINKDLKSYHKLNTLLEIRDIIDIMKKIFKDFWESVQIKSKEQFDVSKYLRENLNECNTK